VVYKNANNEQIEQFIMQIFFSRPKKKDFIYLECNSKEILLSNIQAKCYNEVFKLQPKNNKIDTPRNMTIFGCLTAYIALH
jgi:hypothetical protein